jgi:hypothetical protein
MVSSKAIFNETKRLLHSWVFLVLAGVTAALPAGITALAQVNGPVVQMSQAPSLSTQVILAPTQTAALLLALFYAVFTIYEFDRVYRSNVACMVEPAADMRAFSITKVLALCLAVAAAVTLAAVLAFGWVIRCLGNDLDIRPYLFSYFGLLLPALLFSVLMAAGLYLLVRRVDVSLLLFGGLYTLSLSGSRYYLATWVQTSIPAYSDLFGNALAFRTGLWNRLVWLLASVGLFTLGVLATRRYERGVFRSIRVNARKVALPVFFLVLVLGSSCAYAFEPYFDNSADMQYELISDKKSKVAVMKSMMTNEKNETVRQTQTQLDLWIDAQNTSLHGKVDYTLENTSGVPQAVQFELNPGLAIRSFRLNGAPAQYEDLHMVQMNAHKMQFTLPADARSTIEIEYQGAVQNNRLLQGTLGMNVIGEDYVYLSGSAVFPFPLVDTGSNSISGQVTLPSHFSVITQGGQNQRIADDPARGTSTWAISAQARSLNVIAGSYQMEKISAGGIQIEFYYHPKHAATVHSIRAAQVIQEAIDYFTAQFGPLDYKDVPLKIVETSVQMMGGIASGNISLIGESILQAGSFDARKDLNGATAGVEVLVHEICHQWWGIGVRIPNLIGGTWSAEGLTVYSTYRFLKDKYGTEFAQEEIAQKWEKNVATLNRSFYYRHPEYLDVIPSTYLFDILGTNNSITIYDKMALMIQKAETILGTETFDKDLAKMYRRYKDGLTFDDFLHTCGLTEEEISVE